MFFFLTLIYIYNIYLSFLLPFLMFSLLDCNSLWIRLSAIIEDELYIIDEEDKLDITSNLSFRIFIFSITIQNARSNIFLCMCQ